MARPANLDLAHMRAALLLAERGLGRVWPNPAVGCVIVDPAGHVVGRGFTQKGGRPHAETEALRMAGEAARGATAYVTLEPCSHHGKSPPCADALMAAGIALCVVALEDPYPQVNGQGVARLKAAGIAVDLGLLSAEAEEVNLGFLTKVRLGRPMVTLKLATSLDGRIAAATGDSQWITGETARAHAHRLRAIHDAVLIGSGTALADDPELTCRLPGLADRSPIRIVLDRRLRLVAPSKLLRPAPASAPGSPGSSGTWIVTAHGHPAVSLEPYRRAGLEIVEAATGADGRLDPAAILRALGERGLTRILVEGGAQVAASLVKADLVDRLIWFRAPGLIGGDGLASLAEIGLDRVAVMPRFERVACGTAGEDLVETYRRKPR
ncbi:MAG TPA: bifunctional diaminohydroxyphosphoribosylaminopyrimidine deaminase/5-amino-6-(5-phosphoribosylamino)uracil reductase RibD [Candidatus Cybelea sp.]|nr:bifunctional diaminohydroxyphosphoribosylaminopyrimidine deaminase/5-amino-6-(5-phosphoribosylamino)uracil reductase RibD [Candidatus Cybelea sp.]